MPETISTIPEISRNTEQSGIPRWWSTALRFALPFVLVLGYLLLLYLLIPRETFLTLMGLMTVYSLPPAGKESIIPLGVTMGLPWWLMASSAALFDITSAIFMALNFDLALKIPLLGAWMGSFVAGGRKLLNRHPWLERMSFVGLILFVMVPIQGSGGFGGSIIGRMLGMKDLGVISAIGIGASLSCIVIALCSTYLWDLIRENLLAGCAGIGCVAGCAAVVIWFGRRRPQG
jgi:uncharacterized membrane protein